MFSLFFFNMYDILLISLIIKVRIDGDIQGAAISPVSSSDLQ